MLGDRETEARTAKLAGGGGIGLRERFKKTRHLHLIHANARVDHLHHDPSLIVDDFAFDLQFDTAVLGELARIAQQVEQGLTDLG